jgi:4-phospho-D-threonate 3-dehydrogenase / 4-phospho-D-erythronate 3-dehydrogenase
VPWTLVWVGPALHVGLRLPPTTRRRRAADKARKLGSGEIPLVVVGDSWLSQLMIVVSSGCPASIGPEISVVAAAGFDAAPVVLVGDVATLRAAAALRGIDAERFRPFDPTAQLKSGVVYMKQSGPELAVSDRDPRNVSERAGVAQLGYVEDAYALAKQRAAALVTAAVSKAAIAHCGLARAKTFRGHTEHLQALDSAPSVTMCFWAPAFSSSLVTTHIPLRSVAEALTPEAIAQSTVHLGELLARANAGVPLIAVASLNPHAGEGELLGTEERTALLPGIEMARRVLGERASVVGPVGAETAFRLAAKGKYQGVVAMYHDQATIPMKLVSFGSAVNVTMGLSIVRTSVDHGTAYDIAWQGKADAEALSAALALAARLNAR